MKAIWIFLVLVVIASVGAQESAADVQEAQAAIEEAQASEPQQHHNAGQKVIDEAQGDEQGPLPEEGAQGAVEPSQEENQHVAAAAHQQQQVATNNQPGWQDDEGEEGEAHEGETGTYEAQEGQEAPGVEDDEEEQGQGCQVNPTNNLLCGGPDRGICNEARKMCMCREDDDTEEQTNNNNNEAAGAAGGMMYFGASCECGNRYSLCDPNHCYWCEEVGQCVLSKDDCSALLSHPDVAAALSAMEGTEDVEIPVGEDEEEGGGSSMRGWGLLVFFLILAAGAGGAFYFFAIRPKMERSQYGLLRGDAI